jgi:hypothetical protein
MMPLPPPSPLKQKRRNVALGILRLARGRADGLAQFDATPQAVLQALAPLAAMMIVSLGLAIVSRTPGALQSYLLAGAVGLLSQLVLSYEVARRWGRAAEWYRFAAAFCWCQWAAPVAMIALILIMSVMLAAGVAEDTAAMAGLIGLLGYGIWLHWFLAWRALALTKLQALALVLIVNAATLVLINLPEWAAQTG